MILGRTVNYRRIRNAVSAHRARAAWTPAALFAQGQQGVWYEPKPEYLFQDAAGTIPVTADGDPVGRMLDLSPNGNHATQSTSARRPVFPGLAYDGVDDSLLSIASNQLQRPFTVAVKFSPYEVSEDDAGAYRVFSRGTDVSTRGGIAVNSGNVYINTSGADGFNVRPVSAFDEVALVVRFLAAETVVYIDGQEVVSQEAISGEASSTRSAIGRQAGSSLRRLFDGKIGPLVAINGDIGAEAAGNLLSYLEGIAL